MLLGTLKHPIPQLGPTLELNVDNQPLVFNGIGIDVSTFRESWTGILPGEGLSYRG
jgi:hypothetical protein